MSPLFKPLVIDNDVISTFFLAGVLKQVLSIWPSGSFYVPARVKSEAREWKSRGQELIAILEKLENKGIIIITSLDEDSEEEITAYAKLRLEKHLGEGESASIAIAYNRGFNAITDDGEAREACKELCPNVKTIGSGTLVNWAEKDGIIGASEAVQIRESLDQFFKKT